MSLKDRRLQAENVTLREKIKELEKQIKWLSEQNSKWDRLRNRSSTASDGEASTIFPEAAKAIHPDEHQNPEMKTFATEAMAYINRLYRAKHAN